MLWKKVRKRAGLHESDKPGRLRFCQYLKNKKNVMMQNLLMSDEKIFALAENQEGGYWGPQDAPTPDIHMWQGDVKWHCWGAITWNGPLPLAFLEGGTFKGQAAYDKERKKLELAKAKQKCAFALPLFLA
eukprot:SAG11_NODE_10385_length_835_cov_2.839674_2_plen_130_part_00